MAKYPRFLSANVKTDNLTHNFHPIKERGKKQYLLFWYKLIKKIITKLKERTQLQIKLLFEFQMYCI